MNKTMANRNWDERYLTGDTPWVAHALLTTVIAHIQATQAEGGSVFEVGCGYGLEAITLAKLGFEVTAVDLSITAINQAKKNAQAENLNIHFETFDLMHDANHFKPVDLVLDIAVLHTMENEATRLKFSKAVASLLKTGGTWVNVSCLSPDVLKVTAETGVKAPPALSKMDLDSLCKPLFLLEKQMPTSYQILRDDKLVAFPALISVMKKN